MARSGNALRATKKKSAWLAQDGLITTAVDGLAQGGKARELAFKNNYMVDRARRWSLWQADDQRAVGHDTRSALHNRRGSEGLPVELEENT